MTEEQDAGAHAAKPAPTIVPTVGRIVLYRLNEYDVINIHKRRGMNCSANEVAIGEEYPAVVVRTWGTTPMAAVNLKVMLDGQDDYWATSRSVGDNPGFYHWMEYQKGQAAKYEAAEAKLADAAKASA